VREEAPGRRRLELLGAAQLLLQHGEEREGKPVEIRRKPNRKMLPMWRKGRAPGEGKAEKEKWNSSKDLCAI
jgi:hypothetical protein